MDQNVTKWLSLVDHSPHSVIADPHATTDWQVLHPDVLSQDLGLCLVAGITKLRSGDRLASAFKVDSASGELLSVYWKTESGWIESTDPQAAEALLLEPASLFPFDWELAVPLAVDVFHD